MGCDAQENEATGEKGGVLHRKIRCAKCKKMGVRDSSKDGETCT